METQSVNKFAKWLCFRSIYEYGITRVLIERIADGYPFNTIADAVASGNASHLSEAANMGIAGAETVIKDYQDWEIGEYRLLPQPSAGQGTAWHDQAWLGEA